VKVSINTLKIAILYSK